MVQLKLISQTEKTDRRIGETIKSGPSPIASRSASVKNVATAMEAWKTSSRLGKAPVAAPPAPPKATEVAEAKPAPPGVNLTSGLKLLIAALIVVALVPSLILASLVWLGRGNPPSQLQATQAPPTQASLSPVLTTPATIEASSGEEIGFAIALDGTDAVPPRSIIAIAGLPKGSTFSDGRPYGEAEWNLRTDQIGDLRLILPATANGDFKLSIKLIAPDDTVIADSETLLKVTAPAPEESGPTDTDIVTGAIPDNAGAAAAPAPVEAAVAPPEAAVPAPQKDPVAPPARKPEQEVKPEQAESTDTATSDESGDSVQIADFVNLRDGPSSSSRIMGVLAKGVKVKVSDRKRGWLQVTNSETSEQGWIYSGYVEGASKSSRVRRASRLAAPASQPEQNSDGFWSSVGKWFSSE
jgi:SH3 domain-containing protein